MYPIAAHVAATAMALLPQPVARFPDYVTRAGVAVFWNTPYYVAPTRLSLLGDDDPLGHPRDVAVPKFCLVADATLTRVSFSCQAPRVSSQLTFRQRIVRNGRLVTPPAAPWVEALPSRDGNYSIGGVGKALLDVAYGSE